MASQRNHPHGGNVARWLTVVVGCGIVMTMASAQESSHPLQPPDRSSPRAALKTFLDSGDALGAFLARLPTVSDPCRVSTVDHARGVAVESLNLFEVAPATRTKTGRQAATALRIRERTDPVLTFHARMAI